MAPSNQSPVSHHSGILLHILLGASVLLGIQACAIQAGEDDPSEGYESVAQQLTGASEEAGGEQRGTVSSRAEDATNGGAEVAAESTPESPRHRASEVVRPTPEPWHIRSSRQQ